MVQIHVNQDHDKQFLYESPSTCGIDSLIRNMTQIYNLQSKIQSLVLAVEERVLPNRQDYQSDATLALRRALSEARAYISKTVGDFSEIADLEPHAQQGLREPNKDQALHKKQLSPYVLKDHIQNIEKEFIAYQSIASKDSDLLQLTSDTDLLHEDTAQLWWAGKELQRDKQLCDYIGKNEKTKIVVNLQSPGLVSTQYS